MQQNQHRTILLIGDKTNKLESLSSNLQQLGYDILSAENGREGFRLIRAERPDLVISQAVNLPVIYGLELCRMIRADRELSATPLIFLCELQQNAVELLRAGADDCLTEISNPEYLEAKIEGLIMRKCSEERLLQYYEILRDRHLHITQLIKGTADHFEMSDIEHQKVSAGQNSCREFEKQLNKRIKFGMNMTGALANLLEEQIKSFQSWRGLRDGEYFAAEQEFHTPNSGINYQEVMLSMSDNDLPIH